MKKRLENVWAKEPARVLSLAAAGVVFVAAKQGIVVSHQSVVSALVFALPFLGLGEAIRTQVSPAK